ncbi:hypothetical protein B566_EDAN015686 [Ephemera danica]|nr:hypothetical protein B566_EDAN015686 [Ephemera danica]
MSAKEAAVTNQSSPYQRRKISNNFALVYKVIMSFPFEITDLEGETGKEILKHYLCDDKPNVQVGPHKYTYPYKYRQLGPDIYNFNLRPDDVWIVTFPRSGTTWTQEILYLLNTDLDFKTASNTHLTLRFPQLELSASFSDSLIEKIRKQIKGQQQMEAHLDQILTNATHTMNETKNKRFIKTHIPFSLLPPALLDTCKVVYVCRHPKDVAVSYFHFCCTFVTSHFQGDFATFWDQFENNTCRFGPYWEHLRKSGAWHDYFTPELNARADKWIAENIARLPGFAFPKHQ